MVDYNDTKQLTIQDESTEWESAQFNRKYFNTMMETIISEAVARKVYMYSLTINYNQENRGPPWLLHDFWYTGTSNLEGGRAAAEDGFMDYIMQLLGEIDLIEFAYIVKEYHSKDGPLRGLPHFHVLFFVRSVIGYDPSLRSTIQRWILRYGMLQDFKLKPLKTYLDAKGWFDYIVKEGKFEENHRYILYNEPGIPETSYGEPLWHYVDTSKKFNFTRYYSTGDGRTYRKISELYDGPSPKWWGLEGNPNVELYSEDALLILLRIFLTKSDCFCFKGSVYRKRENTRFSYERLCSIAELLTTNYNQLIVKKLKNIFLLQLTGYQYQLLFSRYSTALLKRLSGSEGVVIASLPYIELNTHLIEFKDGIYNKQTGNFFYHSDVTKEHINYYNNLPFNCYYYFNVSYHNLPKPDYWLNKLQANFPTVEALEDFCANFAVFFHGDTIKHRYLDMEKKGKSIYVEGFSNTGKTTLLANVIGGIIGKENIGQLGNSADFLLEPMADKQILILDEFKYNRTLRESLLKLLGSSQQVLNKKHQAQEIIEVVEPVLILSNFDINQSMVTDEAFRNRLNSYKFSFIIDDNRDTGFIKKMNAELPGILVYCNRLFLKKYRRNFTSTFYGHYRSRKPVTTKKDLVEKLNKLLFLEKGIKDLS